MPRTTTDSQTRSLPDPREVPTMTVEQAGKVLGLGRTASYSAAADGSLPTIRVSKKLLVPTAELWRLLHLEPPVSAA